MNLLQAEEAADASLGILPVPADYLDSVIHFASIGNVSTVKVVSARTASTPPKLLSMAKRLDHFQDESCIRKNEIIREYYRRVHDMCQLFVHQNR